MIIFSTYNTQNDLSIFPFPTGLHAVEGVTLLVVQGIFTENGQKHPRFVRRDNEGYKMIQPYLSVPHIHFPFLGKRSSGSDEICDLWLKDYLGNEKSLNPILCPHPDDAIKNKLRARKIVLRLFDDHNPVQCQEWQFCLEAILGTIWKFKNTVSL